MIDQFFHEIYISSLTSILIFIPVIVLVWSFIGTAIHKRIRIAAALAGIISIVVIVYATVFSRSGGARGYDLIPFSSFQRAIEQPEMYRSMLMNVFIFVPLGMSLVFVFRGSTFKRIMLTVLIGFLLSVLVEALQYFFSLGLAETDDVICNTVGTLIGSTAYPLSLLWRKLIQRLRKGSSNG